MSARLIRQIEKQASDLFTKPVILFMRSGRTFEGELGKVDSPSGTVEVRIEDKANGRTWTILVATEAIEAVSPRWEEAA